MAAAAAALVPAWISRVGAPLQPYTIAASCATLMKASPQIPGQDVWQPI